MKKSPPHLLLWLSVLALGVAASGCKKEKQASAPKKGTSGPAASMNGPAKRTPPRRRIAVSPKVLPIPADMPALRFNVEKLRTTEWFKRSEANIRKSLIAPSPIAKAMTACKVDPINNVEGATVGASLAKGRMGDLVAVLKIDRPTDAVVACMKKELIKNKMEAKPLAMTKCDGIVTKHQGREIAIMSLRDNQLMIIVGKLRKRIAAVLAGKAPSIATTTLYNEVNSQVGPDSLFGGIFPGLPSGDTERLPEFLRGFRTGALIVSLPKGKAALRINLHFEDKNKAKNITQKLPDLLRLAGTQYPGMKDSAVSKAQPKKGWAYMDFKLSDPTFSKIATLLKDLLYPPKPLPEKK